MLRTARAPAQLLLTSPCDTKSYTSTPVYFTSPGASHTFRISYYLMSRSPSQVLFLHLISCSAAANAYPHVHLRRIKRYFPKAKIIFLLREPADRSKSAWLMTYGKNNITPRSLDSIATSEMQRLVERNCTFGMRLPEVQQTKKPSFRRVVLAQGGVSSANRDAFQSNNAGNSSQWKP